MSNPRTFPLEQIKLGQIVVADELASPLPLEGTDVTGQVLGPLVSVSVVQRFGNPLVEPAEIDYLFPLPHEAAIIDFELRAVGLIFESYFFLEFIGSGDHCSEFQTIEVFAVKSLAFVFKEYGAGRI